MATRALRIAFFGTDAFSLQSLKQLYAYRKDLDLSLDLITRSPKKYGRGLKQLSEAETAEFALKAGIPIKRADSSEEIASLGAESRFNLAVAVSYGQLIPSSFLDSLQYGGLNVHPSLLPALRGASPLQYALLKRLPYTGVSVQTLHRTKFDHGDILYQSEKIAIEDTDTVATLRDRLAPIGAQGLITVLKEKRYVDVDKYKIVNTDYKPSYAPKIPKSIKRIDFSKMSAPDIALLDRVAGPLYAFQECFPKKQKKPRNRRVILSKIEVADPKNIISSTTPVSPGEYSLDNDQCIIKTKGGFISSSLIQLEGEKPEAPTKFATSMSARGITKPLLV